MREVIPAILKSPTFLNPLSTKNESSAIIHSNALERIRPLVNDEDWKQIKSHLAEVAEADRKSQEDRVAQQEATADLLNIRQRETHTVHSHVWAPFVQFKYKNQDHIIFATRETIEIFKLEDSKLKFIKNFPLKGVISSQVKIIENGGAHYIALADEDKYLHLYELRDLELEKIDSIKLKHAINDFQGDTLDITTVNGEPVLTTMHVIIGTVSHRFYNLKKSLFGYGPPRLQELIDKGPHTAITQPVWFVHDKSHYVTYFSYTRKLVIQKYESSKFITVYEEDKGSESYYSPLVYQAEGQTFFSTPTAEKFQILKFNGSGLELIKQTRSKEYFGKPTIAAHKGSLYFLSHTDHKIFLFCLKDNKLSLVEKIKSNDQDGIEYTWMLEYKDRLFVAYNTRGNTTYQSNLEIYELVDGTLQKIRAMVFGSRMKNNIIKSSQNNSAPQLLIGDHTNIILYDLFETLSLDR